ncbi:EAL domain-containing protein, partial [Cellulomonas sp. A375-1]|uniref:EAL domain-containing protein n=2 Tax=Cellulomonas TaxID=1707 RepID=UPI000652856C
RLGLRVTAEGVEDDATRQALAALGCDRTQGFLHSRPLPLVELEAWLAERQTRRRLSERIA